MANNEVSAIPVQIVLAPPPVELSFSDKLSSGIGYLWKNDKIFLIVFGVLIILAKITSLFMDLLATSSRKDVEKTQAQDSVLKAKEDSYKSQADSLQKDAENLANTKTNVKEDWNVKK